MKKQELSYYVHEKQEYAAFSRWSEGQGSLIYERIPREVVNAEVFAVDVHSAVRLDSNLAGDAQGFQRSGNRFQLIHKHTSIQLSKSDLYKRGGI